MAANSAALNSADSFFSFFMRADRVASPDARAFPSVPCGPGLAWLSRSPRNRDTIPLMTLVLAEFSAPWSRSVRVAPTTSHPTAMAASTAVRHQHRLRTERCRHRTPGAVPFEAAAHLVSRGITVDDDTVRTAMRIAFEEFKIVLEPSGAIALAAALRHGAEFANRTVALLCCGGSVSVEDLVRLTRPGATVS